MKNATLRQLKVFQTVARRLSFSHAAEELHNRALQSQAADILRHIHRGPGDGLSVTLPPLVEELYSEGYGRYSYAVLDAEGRVLASSHPLSAEAAGELPRRPGIAAMLKGADTMDVRTATVGGTEQLSVTAPVADGMRGAVWLTVPTQTVRDRVNQVWLLLWVGGLVVLPESKAAIAEPIARQAGATNTEMLGRLLYTKYVYLFQAAGLILFVAMIGAIVLTLRQREGVKRQSIARQLARTRAESIQVVKVKPGEGV